MGEKCYYCGIGDMTHPRVYYYECSNCGYAYTIDPVGRITIRTVRLPFKGEKK